MCAVGGFADPASALLACAVDVGGRHLFCEVGGTILVCKGDDRPAEAASGEARGHGAALISELDEQVELWGRDLEVVSEARVPGAEDRAERRPVGPARALEGTNARAHPLVL